MRDFKPDSEVSSCSTAKRLVEIIPTAMALIRMEMRQLHGSEFTIPQLRVLGGVVRGNTSLTSLSEKQGVSAPAMSKMIDNLANKGLVVRKHDKANRRQITISPTALGCTFYTKIKENAVIRLDPLMQKLTDSELDDLARGLDILENIFLKK